MPTRGIERRRKIDLVGRHLDHMHPPHARRLQRQDRGADIAAHLGVVTGDPHQMRDQRRGGRFAVGAGDGDERRIRRVTAALAAEQFDVADHLDAGLLRRQHASSAAPDASAARRASAPARRNSPSDTLRRSAVMKPACAASATLVGAVVAGDHLRAARLQGVAARQPGTAEAEHRDRLARKGGDGDQAITAASAWRGRPAPASPR